MDGARRLVRDVRDETHFQVLRAVEGVRERFGEDGLGSVKHHGTRVFVVVIVAVAAIVAWPFIQRADWTGGSLGVSATKKPPASTPRADTIVGTGANDLLSGGSGADVLLGHDGNDQLAGGAGNDTLHGGNGSDTLWASGGDDVLFGGTGDDVLYAQALDGVDRLVCGPGTDVAYVSRVNGVIADRMVGCEKVVVADYVVRNGTRKAVPH